MLSYRNNFTPRSDGRCIGSLAGWMQRMRAMQPRLAFTEAVSDDPEAFKNWQRQVKKTFADLLKMPVQDAGQPPPRLLGSEPRDGYSLERWEFYPDRWSAIPFLLLRPAQASANAPRPGVLCIPGSAHAKEVLAGEPRLGRPNCVEAKFPDRNCQALHFVKAGFIAAAFDNPGTAECAEDDSDGVETQWASREKLVQGYLDGGSTYLGMSVFQKQCFLNWFAALPEVDTRRIAVAGHSLGSEAALALGVLDDRIHAIVFNDFLCDERRRYCAITELASRELDDGGNWHTVPGIWQEFAFPDLLAAAAPKYLTINEGGAEEFLDKVRAAYRLLQVPERLHVHYYPKFASSEKHFDAVPDRGLSFRDFYEAWCSVDVPDHSFRAQPSLDLLQQAFFDNKTLH